MPLNTRAKRRISILIVLIVGFVVIGFGAWQGRQVLKVRRAEEARVRGIQALEDREWAAALPDLSTAVVSDPMDLEALRGLATARRRVPTPNNTHLRDSMKFASRAVEVAKQLEVSEDVLVETMLEAARIEFATGALLNLEETSSEVIEIDPENAEAIESMYQVRWVRGFFLPDRIALVRKGSRTDKEWLAALRSAGDTSALRWALERVVLDDSLKKREAVIRVLQEGRFEELQKIRQGKIQERALDIVNDWLAETDDRDPRLQFLLAVEQVRANDFDAAREALRVVETAESVDADLLIRAATLREALGNETDRLRALELLARAEGVSSVSPDAAGIIAIRHWSAVRPERAGEVLAETIESNPENVELVLNGLLLSALVDSSAIDGWRDRGQDLLASGMLDALEAETLQLVMLLVDMSQQEDLSLEDFAGSELPLDSLASRTNPLLLTLLGDLQARVGLLGYAIQSWSGASRTMNGRSLEVSRRLIPGLIRNQELHAAFTNALELASNLRTAASIQMLCRSWLALERSGIDAREVQPNFDMWETPRELAETIYEERRKRGEIAEDSLLLLADAIVLEGDRESLVSLTRDAAESGASAGAMIDLARANLRTGTAIVDEMMGTIESLDLENDDARERLLLELEYLRIMGRYADVEAKAASEIPDLWSDQGDRIDQVICGELVANQIHQDRLDGSVVARCVAGFDSTDRLMQILRFVIDKGDQELAERVFTRLVEISGERTPIVALAKAELVLNFPSEDSNRVNEAILLADELLAAGASDLNLQIALARLLRLGPRPAFDRTIEVLSESVVARPGRFDIALMLVDALQETGRYDEAQGYLQQLWRRRNEASPQARRLMSALLAGQGDVGGMVEISCEIAAETDDVFDKLQCIRARLVNGQEQEADEMLLSLYSDPDRPIEVDRAYARRLAAAGRATEMMDVLRTAPGYATRKDRCFELARAAVDLQDWEMAERNLTEAEELDPSDRALRYLRARHEIARPDGDLARAASLLDDLAEDPEITAPELRAIALIRMPVPELRAGVPGTVAALRNTRPLESSFIEITFDASSENGSFVTSEELRDRAKLLVRDPLATAPMWLLAIELERLAFVEALERGEVYESSVIADQVVALMEQARSRFATDNNFPRQLSEMLFVLGDYEGAQINAQEAIRRGPRSGTATADHMALARILANRESYSGIVETFEPFADEMIENPLQYQRSITLLVLGHLGSGDVDGAWRILKAIQGKIGTDGASTIWLTSLPSAPPEAMIKGFRLITEDDTLDDWSLLDSPGLIRALLDAGDDRHARAYQQWRTAFESGDRSLAERIYLAVIADGIEFKERPVEMLERLQAAVDLVPESLMDKIADYPRLTESEQQSLSALRLLVSLAMNNFIAVWSETVLTKPDLRERMDRFRARADSYADRLQAIAVPAPQMVDSLAIHALAEGRIQEAIALATRSVELEPAMPEMRLTMARVLKASGDAELARDEARKGLVLARRYPNENVELVKRIESFLDAI